MSLPCVTLLTSLAMLAFAANSILCRLALKSTAVDAASFTTIRLFSGALLLWLLTLPRRDNSRGNWPSALALFAYAAGFSFAYLSLTAATGALLLFGAVQVTMLGYGIFTGESLRRLQWAGLTIAFAGLVGLLLPGLSAPPLNGSLLMLGAGAAWGIYSIRGRAAGDAGTVTAGNFLRTLPITLLLSLLMLRNQSLDPVGVGYAIASGAVASGAGYAIWYSALPQLRAASAASVQLSVPVIAAIGGVILLGEQPTPRLFVASAAILGGIALVIMGRQAGPNRKDGKTRLKGNASHPASVAAASPRARAKTPSAGES